MAFLRQCLNELRAMRGNFELVSIEFPDASARKSTPSPMDGAFDNGVATPCDDRFSIAASVIVGLNTPGIGFHISSAGD